MLESLFCWRIQNRWFPCEYCEISKNSFFVENLRWMLLYERELNKLSKNWITIAKLVFVNDIYFPCWVMSAIQTVLYSFLTFFFCSSIKTSHNLSIQSLPQFFNFLCFSIYSVIVLTSSNCCLFILLFLKLKQSAILFFNVEHGPFILLKSSKPTLVGKTFQWVKWVNNRFWKQKQPSRGVL